MLRSLPAAALAGLLLVGPPRLSAQTIPSPYRYIEQGQEGGIWTSYLSPGRGRFEQGPGPGTALGVRYAVELAGPLALEGVGTVFPTTRYVIDPDREAGDRVIDEAEVALVGIEARFRFALTGRRTWHSLQPYVFAGGGLLFDAQGSQAEDGYLLAEDRFDFGTKLMTTIGSGLRVLMGAHLALRADASLSLWKLNVPDGYRSTERDLGVVPNGEWISATGLTLGLAWRW